MDAVDLVTRVSACVFVSVCMCVCSKVRRQDVDDVVDAVDLVTYVCVCVWYVCVWCVYVVKLGAGMSTMSWMQLLWSRICVCVRVCVRVW